MTISGKRSYQRVTQARFFLAHSESEVRENYLLSVLRATKRLLAKDEQNRENFVIRGAQLNLQVVLPKD